MLPSIKPKQENKIPEALGFTKRIHKMDKSGEAAGQTIQVVFDTGAHAFVHAASDLFL